jgi:low temperature requirement protein LtrA
MVAGIIVTAAADEAFTTWLVLGGTALFLAGHAAFKATVWRNVPLTRLAAIVVLGLLGTVATSTSALTLGALATVVVILVAVSDRLPWGARDRPDETIESRSRVGNVTGR